MTHVLKVGEIVARSGESARGYFTVGEGPDGSSIRVPILLFHGASGGRTIVVQAAMDGAELNGIEVIRRVAAMVDAQNLAGRLIMIPVVNVPAFVSRERRTPVDQLSMRYPGDPSSTLTDRIAAVLYQEVILQADAVIDLHGGGRDLRDAPMVIWSDDEGPNQAMIDGIARAFGVELNLRLATKKPDQASNTKVGRIVPELGEFGFQEEYIQIGVRGVLNVLRYLRMIEGEPEAHSPQYFLSQRIRLRAKVGGLVHHEVPVGAHVTRGQLLSRVTDIFGTDKELFHAPEDAIVASAVQYPVVYTGDWVVNVALKSSHMEPQVPWPHA